MCVVPILLAAFAYAALVAFLISSAVAPAGVSGILGVKGKAGSEIGNCVIDQTCKVEIFSADILSNSLVNQISLIEFCVVDRVVYIIF